MSHFGVLSYKGAGHLNPLIALARELVARGHRVTFFQTAELEEHVRLHGLEFCSITSSAARPATSSRLAYRWKFMQEIVALRDGIDRIVFDMELFLRQVPPAMAGRGIDAIIMDEIALAGPTVAEILRLPYVVISTSVPHNFGWDGPRSIASRETLIERVQRECHQVSVLRMRGPVRRRLDALRRTVGLGPIGQVKRKFPELAHITQLPQCLDLPRTTLPYNFHYAGPLVDEATRPAMDFPWGRLDGRTMVYATFGTSRRSDLALFHLIAEACNELCLQLVISLGGRRGPESLHGLPGDAIVVKALPQLEILKRADIVISHGGLNTALETLREGKPTIVIPRAFDQPAVAARLERCGVALALPAKDLSAGAIRTALHTLLGQPGYRDAAMRMKAAVCASDGLAHAADVIELSLRRQGTRS
ncbi:glycosyltransferase [Granulicella aggregans]|uniref:glycosyltransferase n=1 Tax=Granulicella aggregans TaxID=474949 RepID=UPI0021E000B5|nr:glycosyltransferase [Granulicella aggregans]